METSSACNEKVCDEHGILVPKFICIYHPITGVRGLNHMVPMAYSLRSLSCKMIKPFFVPTYNIDNSFSQNLRVQTLTCATIPCDRVISKMAEFAPAADSTKITSSSCRGCAKACYPHTSDCGTPAAMTGYRRLKDQIFGPLTGDAPTASKGMEGRAS